MSSFYFLPYGQSMSFFFLQRHQRVHVQFEAHSRCQHFNCTESALLPLECNDKPLVGNVYLSQICDVMERTKEDESPPASSGAPRVMQARRTRKGMNHWERLANNDMTLPNPSGSSRSDNGRKDSKAKHPRKYRRPLLNIGTWNARTLLPEGKFELLINETSYLNMNTMWVAMNFSRQMWDITRWGGHCQV